MPKSSEELYKDLVDFSKDGLKLFTNNVSTYPTQFSFSKLNENCDIKMHLKGQEEVKPRKQFFKDIPELEQECPRCWKYYLNPRNKSVSILDIQLGKKFQKALMAFLNSKQPNNIICEPADVSDKKFPDLKLTKDGNAVLYIELKYQSAPLILAYRQPGKYRECYEGSAALDVKKLKQQWELKQSGKLDAKMVYVYWLDFPCIKGLFFMTLEEMWTFFNNEALVFKRKIREGDYSKEGKVVSEINKIHPSLYQMHSFIELFELMGKNNV